MLLLLLLLLGVVVMGELSLGCRFFIAGGRNWIHTEEEANGEDRGWSARASRNQTGWPGKTTRVVGAWRVARPGGSSSVEVWPGSSLPLPLLKQCHSSIVDLQVGWARTLLCRLPVGVGDADRRRD